MATGVLSFCTMSCTLYVPTFFYYCPSQSEYYVIDRYFMYGTLIQTNGQSSWVLINEQRWNFINKGKINFSVYDISILVWLLSHDRKNERIDRHSRKKRAFLSSSKWPLPSRSRGICASLLFYLFHCSCAFQVT